MPHKNFPHYMHVGMPLWLSPDKNLSRTRTVQRVKQPAMDQCRPMRLLRIREPFDHPDFIFEPKIDGFRSLAYIDRHDRQLVSRNGHVFRQWSQLAEEIAHTTSVDR